MTLQLTSPYFCAGVVVGERAAPIIAYMKRWPEARIRRYAAEKRWRVVRVA